MTYGWSITSQPNDSNASLSNSEQVTTSFTPSLSGDYQVRLTVSDGTDSDSDTVTISVTDPVVVNNPPVANAGDDQTIDLGDSVTLDSSASSDVDNDTLTAVWMIKGKPADSAFTLNTELSSTTFTPDAAGTYELSLSVSDGEESDSDTLFIIVNSVNAENTTPVANAGADQTVDLGIAVTLDASGSTDADNDTLTYVWSFRGIPTGSQVTLNNSNTVSSSFTPDIAGLYVLRVVVTDESGAVSGDNVRITVNEVEQEVANIDRWVINNTNTSDYITSGGSAVLENVQVAELRTENSVEYMYVEATGIPDYSVTLTQDDVDTLNSRPKARADFLAQSTTAVAGDTVEFGENIGYDSSDLNCNDTGGDGYWPPGPACPTDQEKQNYFPTEPQDAAEECETGLGAVGLMVNGTSIYNWSDGATWTNDANVDTEWQYLAPVAESYDVDICGGHATTTGDYHHHFYTTCLANLVGDSGDSHSPIYGFAADGYPVYGPYESDGELAVSGWKTRDYGASESEGGCNTEGERTCFLVDQYDISKGVETTAQGPDIGATVTSQSRNDFIADSGFFYEDYYYAQLPATGAQLDQHNGHDNDDGRGYHYHITLELVDGELTPSFPYTVGPNFKGDLPDNTFSRCSGATGGPRP
ncbi:MAG: YHYH protein [Gammaproteobacteria bacterium]|nr:YHYH protein [Gammaproteobacteria bacterium]